MNKIILTLVTIFTISGCALNQEQTGAITGAVVGGVIGHQIGKGSGRDIATVAGVLIGAAIGGNIGRHMDQQDRLNTNRALETSRSGRTTTWSNPDSGYTYGVTPTETYQSDNTYCREYTTTATIGGKTEQVYGTACRQPDGSWKAQQ